MPRSIAPLSSDARAKLLEPLGALVAAGDAERTAGARVFLSSSISDSDRWMLRSAGLDVPIRGDVPRDLEAELSAADLADLAAIPAVLRIEPLQVPEAAPQPELGDDESPAAMREVAPMVQPVTVSTLASAVLQALPSDGWQALFAADGTDAAMRTLPLVCWAVVRDASGVGAIQGMVADGAAVVAASSVPRFVGYRPADAGVPERRQRASRSGRSAAREGADAE
jgi:hypothetical protein